MFKRLFFLLVFLLSLTALCSAGTAGTAGPRTMAMGGAGVASGTYDSATGLNPALLTVFGESDDFAWRILAVGIEVSDKDDVLDTLDDISDDYDLLEEQIDSRDIPGAVSSKDKILEDLAKVDGKPIRANVGLAFSLAAPSKDFAWGIDLRSSLDVGVMAKYDPDDEQIINAAILSGNTDILDDTKSFGLGLGAIVTELSLSFAKEFKTGDLRYSFGISPKYQRVDTILYVARANDFDSDDIDSSDLREDDANFNLDLGGSLWLTDNINLALVVRDVFSQDYETVEFRGYKATYKIKPTATAGVAYCNDWFTAALDADLIKRESYEELDKTQFIRTGIEFDLAQWVQLRSGYRYDLEDVRANVFTGGIGLSPFDTVHFDITGLYGEDETYGGALELKVTS